ncbi:MAG: DUF3987 domain-containing protein [Xenococcaceae cyanobacterium]
MQFPQIDRDSANRQLRLLGYQEPEQKKGFSISPQKNDRVYLRFFYPSDDPRKENDKGRKSNSLNWREIEKYQREGRGVYFVVNGNGHKNEDVVSGRAIFIEHDDLPKDFQLNLWQTLNLPEPTFQVDTGGKSIHSYWVFEQPIPVEQWCSLQKDLLEFADADRSIKNPARVMRLAGAWHISINESGQPIYNQSRLVSASGHKYGYEQLRAIIPSSEQGREGGAECARLATSNAFEVVPSLYQQDLTEQTNNLTIQAPLRGCRVSSIGKNQSLQPTPFYLTPERSLPKHPDQIQIPVSASVPLEQCLAKESRYLLEHGVAQGGRNSNGAKLALDLIGTERYLQTIGQAVEGDPRQLLEDYSARCTPPLPAVEVESIWKSASRSNPNPSCTPSGVEACIKGWYWREVIKPSQARRNNGGRPKNNYDNNNEYHSNTNSQPTLNLSDRLRQIVTSEATESEQHMALMDLAEAMGRPYRDIEKLAGIIRSERDLDDEVVEALAPLKQNLTNYRQRLDLNRYLHPTLAKSLIATAEAMPTAPEYLFTTLLSASASVIGTASKVIVNAEGGYTQPCIFWTGNVSHSGQMKTPVQKVIIDPLIKAEAEAYETYQEEKADYEREKNSESAPPTRKRHLVNNLTIPVKIRLHAENKRGLLEYIDELVSDFNRLNQYTRGKGDDLQTELGLFNGSSVNYDRSDAKLFLPRTGISKTGTYQWDTLARLMADEVNFTSSGYASRFLLCSIPDAPPRFLNLFNSYAAVENLQKLLTKLYGELEQLPERDYALSRSAKTLFQAWNHNLVTAEMDEAHFGMSLVYAKIESYTARIALWLHIINNLLSGQSPPPTIDGKTMQAAIEIASFYLWQHRFIQAHNSPSRKLEGIFLKAQLQAEKLYARLQKGMSASYLKTRLNAAKKWSVEKIRNNIFRELAANGLGRIEGEGSNMVYIPFGEEGETRRRGDGETRREFESIYPQVLLPQSPESVGGVGAELVNPPTPQSFNYRAVQTEVGEIDGEGRSGFEGQPNHHVGGNKNEIINFSSSDETQNITNSTSLTAPAGVEVVNEQDSSNQPPVTTNNTNSVAQPVVKSENTAIGATHQLDHQPPINQHQIDDLEFEIIEFDFQAVLSEIDRHIERLGGTLEYWKNYLLDKYNVASRLFLSDEQIIEFRNYLQELS